jgi:hypothetical protein
VRIALVTGADEPLCAVASHTLALLPRLREVAHVDRFVADDQLERAAPQDGESPLPVSALRPREFDQIVYQVADEPRCAFMTKLVRAVGGTVALYDWALPDLAAAAFPALAAGGWRGWAVALREGGPAQATAWRRARRSGEPPATLTLNRSIVRHADAFLVHSEEIGLAVRTDRNARTALAVVPGGSGREGVDEVCPWGEVARRWVGALATFPHAHSAGRPLVRLALEAASGRGG